MQNSQDWEAYRIWDIARTDCLGNLLDPEDRRGPEVHPDLIRFKDWFYCLFKAPGGSRIIRSPDAKTWETVQLGRVGLRFAVTPWGDLMTVGTCNVFENMTACCG